MINSLKVMLFGGDCTSADVRWAFINGSIIVGGMLYMLGVKRGKTHPDSNVLGL